MQTKKIGMKIISTNATPGQVRAFRIAVLNAHRKACHDQPTWAVFGGVIHMRGLWFQVVSS